MSAYPLLCTFQSIFHGQILGNFVCVDEAIGERDVHPGQLSPNEDDVGGVAAAPDVDQHVIRTEEHGWCITNAWRR